MGTILGYTTHSRRELVRSSSRPRRRSGGEYPRFQCSALELIWTAFLPYLEAGEKRRKRDPRAWGARAEHEGVKLPAPFPLRTGSLRGRKKFGERIWQRSESGSRSVNPRAKRVGLCTPSSPDRFRLVPLTLDYTRTRSRLVRSKSNRSRPFIRIAPASIGKGKARKNAWNDE